jgi:hypothetical protein
MLLDRSLACALAPSACQPGGRGPLLRDDVQWCVLVAAPLGPAQRGP